MGFSGSVRKGGSKRLVDILGSVLCVCVFFFFQLWLLANQQAIFGLGRLYEPEEEEEEEDTTELSSEESRFLEERSGVATGDDW